MKVKTQDYNDVTVVELQGELDGEFAELFRNTVTEVIKTGTCKKSKNKNSVTPQKAGIVLDMSNIGFIDSEGLEQLLWARDYCNENRCQLRLAGLDENCTKILEVTRLENEFDRYVELAEAVMSFA